ncbi:TPA: type II secretion system F family protein [Stenotrophomonas maltophilia]|jgi:type IV pilus assembly protein PilC|uniref:type II secretion system F family protein n=1 Tax=Stenotrophomonas maltophilia TaxID=40324 RepID=UPI000C15F18D|nr:type II secretion system F family protein [Stenotrophomonas maltophilia]MBA0333837.1 type II secretion system F family protein [Stenotrophomonas maltophilia]MBA0444926.1 type II secretion system F family protein [Stenotrophomonas maltophilia]MBH1386485.1 type II secretion system F family protein [Stenotrophomonas maltophilia]MBN5105948.1 type II secretion system F family protein [Stenotrophomonas maltophilia]MBN5122409.1 type II secretion system F family protein [Stenotrophomonas maltophili
MSVSRSAIKKEPVARATMELQPFVWEGTDKRGVKMKGEQLAKNANLLRAELRRQGINPGQVKPKPKPLFGAAGSPVKPKDIAFFSRQMATMMKSGVPIVSALDIIASGHKNPRMKKLVDTIRTDIEGGSSMYEAISKHPVQFDELYRNLVRAGEGAGVLETVLDTVATYKENIEALKGKIKKALFYPIMVVVVAMLVSGIMLVFVVPQFEDVFKSFGAELPAFTQMVVNLSRFMVSWWWLMLLVAIGTAVALVMSYKRSPKMQHAMDRLVLKVPVIGQIMHNSAIARFSRTTAVTFKAGVPLVEALGIVAGATGNTVYEEAVLRMRDDVSVGYPVNMSMKQTNLFPHMVIQMTGIGEEAGALDAMLFKVAEYYEQEVNNSVDALSSLLEPMIMVFIGTIVGGMVIAMYLPIFKLGAVVG